MVAQDVESYKDWFDTYLKICEQYQIKPNNTWNMDEQGYAMGLIGKSRVVTVAKSMYKAVIKQDGNREWTSLIECVSATGEKLKIWIIFKAKIIQKRWYEALEEGGYIAVSDKGWTDSELCYEWLTKSFDPTTRQYMENPDQYRLLLFDGHDSHCTSEVIEHCLQNKIILLCLPSHSTHLLQPLDVGIFGPLAQSYRKHLEEDCRLSEYYIDISEYYIDKMDFIQINQLARQESVTSHNITSAWRKSGLIPYNPSIVLRQLPQYHEAEPPSRPPLTPFRNHTLRKDMPAQAFQTSKTPRTVQEVDMLIERLSKIVDETRRPDFIKLCKGTKIALSTSTTQQTLNEEIIAKQRDVKCKLQKGNYGRTRVLDAETIRLRNQAEQAKKTEKEATAKAKEASAMEKQLQQTFKALGNMVQCYPQNKRKIIGERGGGHRRKHQSSHQSRHQTRFIPV